MRRNLPIITRRVPYRIILASAGLLTVSLVVVSPLGLRWLQFGSRDWTELADVGQAYGGISALLSGLALLVIALSLVLQQQHLRANLVEMDRRQHLDLIMIGLENEELLLATNARLGIHPNPRVIVYANLWVSYWLMLWELGTLTEEGLHSYGIALFQNHASRDWWSSIGAKWAAGLQYRRVDRFIEIMTDACKIQASRYSSKAQESDEGPSSAAPGGTANDANASGFSRTEAIAAASLVGAIVATAFIRRIRRRLSR